MTRTTQTHRKAWGILPNKGFVYLTLCQLTVLYHVVSLTVFPVAGYSCGGLRTQAAGVISSSNFPHSYKSNVTCTWKITVDSANHITLNFTDFDLENSSTCERAHVRVYDGLNITEPSLGTFCGSGVPRGVRSSGNKMLVVYKANRGHHFKGFRAYYDSGKCHCSYQRHAISEL